MRQCFISAKLFGLLFFLAALFACPSAAAGETVAANEPFTAKILATGLDFPWEMLWGPDNQLWITERHGRTVAKIDPQTGLKKTLMSITEAAVADNNHEGVLGMALSPGFLTSGCDNYVYVYYTRNVNGERSARIVRYDYNRDSDTLGSPITILDNLPAGDDHNAGRLVFGPDGKLHVSIGEQGHNQGANFCLPIQAQDLPTQSEIDAKNYNNYRGKTLRVNPDGSIPDDNPVLNGVRSHIFTYGHRNPQGLVYVGDILFSSEQGPSSDDEINILEAGGNYGWPHVAGFIDDQAYVYANYSAAANCASLAFDPNVIPEGVPVQKESEWQVPDNFKPPLKTFYTVRDGYDFSDGRCSQYPYLCWPTIAPACIRYYPADGAIKPWRNSLVVSSLKNGCLYRMPLSASAKQIQGDVFKYFHTQNRYRAVQFDPEGKNIYVCTDSAGLVLDENGIPANGMKNPGSIIVFSYNEQDPAMQE